MLLRLPRSTLFPTRRSSDLIISAAIEMYYSYWQNREALSAVQREKALGAAAVIEQFVKEIENQVGWAAGFLPAGGGRSEEHTSELQSLRHLVCRLLLEKKKH